MLDFLRKIICATTPERLCHPGLTTIMTIMTLIVPHIYMYMRIKYESAEHGPVACLVTKTAKVVSRSNDYQKLIDLITFCEALNRLASVASICAHHIMRVLKSSVWVASLELFDQLSTTAHNWNMQIVFLSFLVRLLKAVLSVRPYPKHWAVEKNHLWLAFQLNCHG